MKALNTSSNSSKKHVQLVNQTAKRVPVLVERQRSTEGCSTTSIKITKPAKLTHAIEHSSQCDGVHLELSALSNKHLADRSNNNLVDGSTSSNHSNSHDNNDSQKKKNVNTNLISEGIVDGFTESNTQPILSQGFCDRMTITFGSNDLDTKDFSSAVDDLIGKSNDGPYLTRAKIKRRIYEDNYRIMSSTGKKLALLQFRGKKSTMRFGRLDFNPRQKTETEIEEIRQLLRMLFGKNYRQLLSEGRITRFDVSVDMKGQSIHDLIAYTVQTQENMLWMRRFAKNGAESWQVGSHYIGAESSGRRVIVYDKARQLFEVKGISPTQAQTRVEVRYCPDKMGKSASVKDVLNASNPLSALQFVYLPSSIAIEPSLEIFWPCIKEWGLNVALSKIKDKGTRANLRRAMGKHRPDWWNSERIWKQALHHVRSLRLLSRDSFPLFDTVLSER